MCLVFPFPFFFFLFFFSSTHEKIEVMLKIPGKGLGLSVPGERSFQGTYRTAEIALTTANVDAEVSVQY